MLDHKDGKRDFLHPLFLDDLDVKRIAKYQFEQTGESAFILRCVASASDTEELERKVRDQIDGMLRKKTWQM